MIPSTEGPLAQNHSPPSSYFLYFHTCNPPEYDSQPAQDTGRLHRLGLGRKTLSKWETGGVVSNDMINRLWQTSGICFQRHHNQALECCHWLLMQSFERPFWLSCPQMGN
ncbi:hypothetical protein N7510_006177 [Penicillium lagena]|uniref:uncharacterized protein n=1 Tax=Penicillium lagena TaxID=94218 RepID=UPI002542047F|nr:uncharacterized protein N7510_006177 [Penicillium lagena]KAJ5612983.1 hypothetical protein N7510_006177 [Penicillium lagena]